MKKDIRIFLCSVFFVLGFSLVFSLVGVLLQSVLSNISYDLQIWLGRIGGVVIIIFGLYLLDLINFTFLQREYKIKPSKFKSAYLTSFAFGAAFAVGWTPCVGPVLGAVLTLAVTQPGTAFFLMLSYSLGLGIPFMLVGLFTNQAQDIIAKAGKTLTYIRYFFAIILILLGILVFTNQLSRIAAFPFASALLLGIDAKVGFGPSLNIGIAFLAGLVSFLSPCVLPLIPAFLSYLASVVIKK